MTGAEATGTEATDPGKQSNILPAAIAVACVVHLALIFGVTFDDIRDCLLYTSDAADE